MGRPNVIITPLTDKQLKVLVAAQEAGLDRSITKICKTAGVTKKSFYEWMNEEGNPQFQPFRDEWSYLPQRMLGKHLPGIVAAQIHRAVQGSTSAARLLFEFAGMIADKSEQKVDVNVKVDVDLLSDEDQRTYRELLARYVERGENRVDQN